MPHLTPPRRCANGDPRQAARNGWKCSDTALPARQSDSRGLAASYLAPLILLYLAARSSIAFALDGWAGREDGKTSDAGEVVGATIDRYDDVIVMPTCGREHAVVVA
jgi:hypothetical protein